MDSLLNLNQSAPASPQPYTNTSVYEARYKLNLSIIEKSISLSGGQNSDKVDVGLNDLYKGLSVTAQRVVDKINELLAQKLPNGVQSLKPEQVTPEATADTIVKGATAFFDVYAKQHKDLKGEELLNSFLAEIKKGIQSGYDDAFQTLEGLGAFEFDGVKAGVEQTKILIEQKLAAFEAAKRKELGIDPQDVTGDTAKAAKSALLAQAGTGVVNSGSLNLSA